MSHIQNFWNDKRTSNSNSVSNCCGCSACASRCPKDAINMRYDHEGFLYPVVESKRCIECGLCLNVCPINDKENLLKPYKKTYAGYSLNEKILYNSTSGGFITALSLKIIEMGGAVAGVRYTSDYIKSEYFLTESKDDLLAFASSKYVQSEKNNIYNYK